MKKLIIVLISLMSVSGYATSNIVGLWSDKDKALSIDIVDDPSNGNYVAGDIWKSISPENTDERGYRIVNTENISIKCEGLTQTNGITFGNCNLKLKSIKVRDSVSQYSFAVGREEGKKALNQFKHFTSDYIVKSGVLDGNKDDLFSFGLHPNFEMVTVLIHKKLIFN